MTRLAPALLLVVLAAGPAAGDDVTRFKGSMVTFQVEARSVKGFTLSASVLCLAGAKSANEIRVIPLMEAAPLDADGNFKLAVDQNGTRATVSGHVTPAAAEGRYEVYYTKTLSSFDPLSHSPRFDVLACSARAPWTARRDAGADTR